MSQDSSSRGGVAGSVSSADTTAMSNGSHSASSGKVSRDGEGLFSETTVFSCIGSEHLALPYFTDEEPSSKARLQ